MSTQGQTVLTSNNWMALEPHIVNLVKSAVQGMQPAVHVVTSADLSDVKERAQIAPAVHVVYGGFRITDGQGIAWELTHTWLIVAAVRNVADIRSGQAARTQAGSLAAMVLGGLVGAQIPGSIRALEPITPPPARYAGGFQYVPTAIKAVTVFRKP